jgi:hypothetical protein
MRVLLFGLCLWAIPAVAADAPASQPAPGDALTVSVLTFGPGSEAFFKFGHNGIWIHDPVAKQDKVYNFGTFFFDSPWLIVDFLKGRFQYWLSVEDIRGTIYSYRSDDRSVAAQELDLTGAQKLALQRALDDNAKPENAAYKYDYYGDNCSTRVRDAIDRVTDGAVHAASHGPATLTFRQHTLRLTCDLLWEYTGLDILMNDTIDKPTDVWAEMFLPEILQRTLRQTKLPSGAPLVKAERMLVTSSRPPERTVPPSWTIWFLLAGTAVGGIMIGLARLAPRLQGALVALFGGVFGLIGSIFWLLWMFTDHTVAAHNENILQCAPWALVLTGCGIKLALGRPSRWALPVARSGAAFALLGLACKVLPFFDQDNWRIIAFLTPLWCGLAYSLQRRRPCP